jgi:AbrB family looped-hinge helix DNA binding protein
VTNPELLDDEVRNSYDRGMRTTVSEKGQITIPKRLRDRLGLRPGTVLEFEEANGRLVGRKLVAADHLDDLYGILPLPPGGTDAFIREIRGPGPDEEAGG